MHFHQFYLGCLAHASYLIGDDGECVIVDPQRDVEGYLEEAARRGLEIKHVVETHLHADFVSGHMELARRTGATVHVGARANATFEHRALREGDEIRVGAVTLRALETPGHTPESICLLVFEGDDGVPTHLLSGDTLFIGDVGRPDLAGGAGFTPEQMAASMYDTLREKILPLPDDVEVFPAHGAGSACGRNMSTELSCTIGRQKALNWALQPQTKEEFVAALTEGQLPAPAYFAMDAQLNREGAADLGALPAPPQLDVDAFAAALQDATVLDVRAVSDFQAAHVPGSLWVGLDGQFASWCGVVLPLDRPLLLVADERDVAAARLRLARVGLADVRGVLAGGVEAWRAAGRAVATLPAMDVTALRARMERRDVTVLDVRQPPEHEGGHVPGAGNAPLRLPAELADTPVEGPTAVICESGYRSTVACSMLLARAAADGRTLDLLNVTGGTAAWRAAGFPVETHAPV